MISRRILCRSAAAAAIISSRATFAAAECDLLDVAIRSGHIVGLKKRIPESSAAEVMHADGRLVVPGLIDIHLHARDAELPPAEILATGVTTMVDAGSRGADNIETTWSSCAGPSRWPVPPPGCR